jgi:hypothetical protein
VQSDASAALDALCFDPQTSGGLLASVTPAAAVQLEADGFARVGLVEAGQASVRLI